MYILFSFIEKFSPLYRLLGAVMLFIVARNSWQDVRFFSVQNDRKTFTFNELVATNRSEIPKYITLKNINLGDFGVQSTSETSGSRHSKHVSLMYPVFRNDAIEKIETPKQVSILFVQGQNDKLANRNEIVGEFTDESLNSDTRQVLESDGSLKVVESPIIIRAGDLELPNQNLSIGLFVLCVLSILAIIGSFLHTK